MAVTIFEETVEKILLAARELRLPGDDVARIEQGLRGASEGREQFEQFVDVCQRLARQVSSEMLFVNSELNSHGWTSSTNESTQKTALRRAAKEAQRFLDLLLQQRPSGDDGSGQEERRSNGKKHQGYSDSHWLRIVYAPQLRYRLLAGHKDVRCEALGINLKGKEFPSRMDEAERMDQQSLFDAFKKLEMATGAIFGSARLDEAVMCCRQVADASQESFVKEILEIMPEELSAKAQNLFEVKSEQDRLKLIMEGESTAELVAEIGKAYGEVVREKAEVNLPKPAPTPEPQPEPEPTPSQDDSESKKSLPVRLPARKVPINTSPNGGTERGGPEMDETTKKKLEEIQQRIEQLEKAPLTEAMRKEMADERKHMESLIADAVKPVLAEVKKVKEEVQANRQQRTDEQAANRSRATVLSVTWKMVGTLAVLAVVIWAINYAVRGKDSSASKPAAQQQQVEKNEVLPTFDF